jgi:hypothetical protein
MLLQRHVYFCLFLLFSFSNSKLLSPIQVWNWREDAREMLQHSLGSYMQNAYPFDELKPLSCNGRRWDQRERGNLDDSLGGFALTLIDSLDSIAVTGDLPGFRCAVSRVINDVGFANRSVIVSVFETAIRVIGGLLSAHILSVDEQLGIWREGCLHIKGKDTLDDATLDDAKIVFDCSLSCINSETSILYASESSKCLKSYNGQLLSMARELALRLLPAFDTPTGLPYHRINLQTGIVDPTSRESCTAAAGTHLLEFGILSRLTGDPSFEAVSRKAIDALWQRKAPLTGLIGSAIDVVDGTWRTQHSGVGAGIDSFIEYLLKSGIALDDDTLIQKHTEQAEAIHTYMTRVGNMHLEVSMSTGGFLPNSTHSDTTRHQMFTEEGHVNMSTHIEDDFGALGSNKRTYMFPYASSLQAFYPALEVLSGSVSQARQHYLPLAALWSRFDALPEQFDTQADIPLQHGKDSPLRPELIESNYYLYTATRDPSYLSRAASHLNALNRDSRVVCGYASVADITVTFSEFETNTETSSSYTSSTIEQKELLSSIAHSGIIPGRRRRLDDRMDSFFVSETAKYLFKTFDHALWHWCEGPTLGKSWNSSECVESFSHFTTSIRKEEEEEEEEDKSNSSLSYYNNLLSKYYPKAHPLAYGVRNEKQLDDISTLLKINSDGTTSDMNTKIIKEIYNFTFRKSSLSSLPLDELRTLYSTEGHLFLLGSWSLVPLYITNSNTSFLQKQTDKKESLVMSKSKHNFSLTCPRLVPHPHAGEPTYIAYKIADAAIATLSTQMSSSSTTTTTTISSVLNTCLVSSVLDAMPFLSSSNDYNSETENLFYSKTFPYSIQGSIDLEPDSLSTYYNLTIRPIIQQAFASHTFFQQEINQRQAAANAVASALSPQTASFLGSFMSALGGAFSSHSHITSLDGKDGIVIRNGFTTSFTAFANDPPGIGFSITPWTSVQVVPIDRLTTSLNSIGWTRRIASSIVFNCFSPPAFQGMPPPQVSCNIHIDTTSTSMKHSKSRNLRIALRTSILSQQQLEGLVPPSIPLLRWSESQYTTAKALEEKGNNEFEKKRQQFETSKNTYKEYQTHPNSLILLTPASSALFGPIITTYGLRGLLPIFSNPRAACSLVQPPPSSISESTQYVLVALRGGCTFAKKALVAQSSGYSALLVMDLLSNDDYAARGGEFDFIMADDAHFTATPSSTSSSPLDSTNNPSETQQSSTQQSSTVNSVFISWGWTIYLLH